MKKTGIVVTTLLLLGVLLIPWSKVQAATDGIYSLAEVTPAWEGTDASRSKSVSPDYDYSYGDDTSLTYQLPWSFSLYGQSYSQITVDTNGNVWFGATGFGHSFNLASNGRGPVVSAWNNDLSSYYHGGVFIQHKTSPERVVIEWVTETYTDEGSDLPHRFEAVLFQNGTVRIDYHSFSASSLKDFGSGISNNDTLHYLDLSANYGNAHSLAGRSFGFVSSTPGTVSINNAVQYTNSSSVTLALSPPDAASVTHMCISNTDDCSSWEPYAATKEWTLPAGDGTKTVNVWYRDNIGYASPTPCTASITLDQTPPSVVSIPADGTYTSNPTLTLNGTVSDNGGIQSFRINGTPVPLNASGDFAQGITLATGPNAISLDAADLAGNVSSRTITVNLDQTAPVLAISSPGANSTVNGQSVSVTGTVDEASSVYMEVNGGLRQYASVTGNSFAATIQLVQGQNTILVSAMDRAGNISQTTFTVTCILPLETTVSPATIAADYKGSVRLQISNMPAQGSEVTVEQLVDSNRNGIVDGGDYVIRSCKVRDGVASANPNVQGDEDGGTDSALSTSLNYNLANDLYHSPGNYLFRITNGTETTTKSFTVSAVSTLQTISGTVTTGTTPVPGAMVRLLDKWQRQVSCAIADEIGRYTFNVKDPGSYLIMPVTYGYATPSQAITPVTLAASQNVLNLDLSMVPGLYNVAGRVSDSFNASGIAGVWVEAKGTNYSSLAMTGLDGTYHLSLPSGQYSIGVAASTAGPNPSGKGYVAYELPTLNPTVAGDLTGMDISLARGTLLVTGRVLDEYGLAVPGMPVLGRLSDPQKTVAAGLTDTNGDYALALSGGENWRIGLEDSSAQVFGYIGNAIEGFSTTTSPSSGNNLAAHSHKSWVSGTVKDSLNNPLAGVPIRIRNSASSFEAAVKSGSDGTYFLGAYAGSWIVDALAEELGLPDVQEQMVTMAETQTVTADFITTSSTVLSIDPVTTPTAVNSQTISGTMPSGSTITVTVDTSASVGSVTYPTPTTWSCLVSNLAEGTNTIAVAATDTSGNQRTASVVVVFVNPSSPDLVITALGAPATAASGETITIPFTVKNRGTVKANTFYVGLYLSTDSAITSSDKYLGQKYIGTVLPGAQPSYTATITIPGNTSGTYYIGAIVDSKATVAESDESNNTIAASSTAITYGPDLIITNLAAPASASSGGAVTVPVTIKNQGTGTAGKFYVTLYLSTDNVITSADKYLGQYSITSLAPGADASFNTTITIPANVSGPYYIGAIADSKAAIGESDELNNAFAAGPTTITYGPDLVVTSVGAPANASTGETVSVPVIVKNQGTGNSGTFYVGLYLSTDNVITSADKYLGQYSITSLAPGADKSCSITVTIPVNTSGTYYIGAIADSKAAVGESDESNNAFAANSTIITYGPDLIVTNVTSPTNASSGETITVPVTVRNQGTGKSGTFYVGLYLSSDNVITSSDKFLGQKSISSLAQGAEVNFSSSVTIPGNTSGTYYIGAIADSKAAVGESDESNNAFASSPTTITYGPELIVTSLAAPASASSGETVTVPVTVRNQGTGTTGKFYMGIYLSTDNVITSSDKYLGQNYITSLPPDSDRSVDVAITIPATAAGTYYLGAIADNRLNISESVENNNSLPSGTTMVIVTN